MQTEELNGDGELYIRQNPKLNVKVVNGSSLAAAIVLNSIPKGTTQLLFRGKLNKVAHSIVFALCEKGIKVLVFLFYYIYKKWSFYKCSELKEIQITLKDLYKYLIFLLTNILIFALGGYFTQRRI